MPLPTLENCYFSVGCDSFHNCEINLKKMQGKIQTRNLLRYSTALLSHSKCLLMFLRHGFFWNKTFPMQDCPSSSLLGTAPRYFLGSITVGLVFKSEIGSCLCFVVGLWAVLLNCCSYEILIPKVLDCMYILYNKTTRVAKPVNKSKSSAECDIKARASELYRLI